MGEVAKLVLSNWITVSFLVLCVISVVSIVANQVRRFACQRQELAFKRDLVERGLSVDEIERLISASGTAQDEDSE